MFLRSAGVASRGEGPLENHELVRRDVFRPGVGSQAETGEHGLDPFAGCGLAFASGDSEQYDSEQLAAVAEHVTDECLESGQVGDPSPPLRLDVQPEDR